MKIVLEEGRLIKSFLALFYSSPLQVHYPQLRYISSYELGPKKFELSYFRK